MSVRGTLACAITVLTATWAAAAAPAATSSSVVGAVVPSASAVDASGCLPGVASTTSFSLVVNTTVVGGPCTVVAGSTNDSLRLRLFQGDRSGVAMYSPTRGALVSSGFGTGGRAFAPVLSGTVSGNAMVEQPDGKLVVVGSASNGANRDVVVARFLPDGSLDPDFDGTGSGNGIVTYDVNGNDNAAAVDLDSQGRIVIAGTTNPAGQPNSLVMRLLPTGTPDGGFNGTGIREEDNSAQDGFFSVDVRADDRIVAGGYNGGYVNGITVVYDTNGTRWSGFNGGGTLMLRSPGANFEQVRVVRALPDGRVLVIARRENPSPQAFVAYVIRANGTGVDTSWGASSGWTIITFPSGNASPTALVADAGGGWTIVGHDPTDFAAARITAGGLLDTGWGASGLVTADLGGAGDVAHAAVLESTGHVAMLGRTAGGNFALARVSSTGVVSTAAPLPNGWAVDMTGNDTARAVLLRPDGDLLVAGDDGTRLALARMAGIPFADYDGVGNALGSGPAASAFGACLETVTGGTPMWTAGTGCPATDGVQWNPVPASSAAPGASVARRTTAGGADVVATLRFGIHVSGTQWAASYVAPITFEVVAPDA